MANKHLKRCSTSLIIQFSSVQSLSRVWVFEIPWAAAHQASLSITNSWSLLKLMPIESVMPFNHLIHCHPLLFLSSIFPSIRGFSNESALHIRWPKYWSFSFNICPSNEYSGLISFRMDWFLAVQGALKSLLQHHSSNASILIVLISSLLEKCKSKLQWDITSHQSEWLSSKVLQTINAGEGVERGECSCTVGGNLNWYSHYGRQYGDFLKI